MYRKFLAGVSAAAVIGFAGAAMASGTGDSRPTT